MTSFLRYAACGVLALSILSSCKKDSADPTGPGPLTFHLDNVVGSQDLALNARYTNAAGETFRVSTLQYYISNIRLKKEDGTIYTVPQDSSYFFIKETNEDSDQDCDINNIPAGKYVAITFTVGVDSLRSRMDASKRTGVLDPADMEKGGSMYWSWNPGYIAYKFEGSSPVATGMMDTTINLHVGGYGGTTDTPTENNNRTITLTFPEAAIVNDKRHPEVHTYHDVLKMLDGPGGRISFATTSMVHSPAIGSPASKIADNYARSFQVGHVHND